MPEDASLDQFVTPEATDSENESEDAGGEAEESEATTVEANDAEAVDAATPDDTDSESADAATPASSEETTEPGSDDSLTASDSLDGSSVEPAVSTYAWSPDDGECADCGASAETLWLGEGQKTGDLVCPDCKEW